MRGESGSPWVKIWVICENPVSNPESALANREGVKIEVGDAQVEGLEVQGRSLRDHDGAGDDKPAHRARAAG